MIKILKNFKPIVIQVTYMVTYVNSFQSFPIVLKFSILDVWQGPGYAILHAFQQKNKKVKVKSAWKVSLFGVFLVRIFPRSDTFHAVKSENQNCSEKRFRFNKTCWIVVLHDTKILLITMIVKC